MQLRCNRESFPSTPRLTTVFSIFSCASALAVSAAGCLSTPPETAPPHRGVGERAATAASLEGSGSETAPPKREAAPAVSPPAAARSANATAGDPIRFPRALALALGRNPDLIALAWQIDADEARALQASLLPNPELQSQVESFAGSGPFREFRESETTLAIAWPVLLGGKREKRTRVARLAGEATRHRRDAKRLEVAAAVAAAFTDLLAAQRRVEIDRRALELSREVLRSFSERVASGKSSPLEETRGRILVGRASAELERARHALERARLRLAALWGEGEARFGEARGDLEAVVAPPPLADLAPGIDAHPVMARRRAEVAAARAALELAAARAWPDLRLLGGARLLAGSDETAAVVGLSLPLPLFDRNQGGRREAAAQLGRAEVERRAERGRLATRLAQAWHAFSAAYREILALRDEVLPAALKAFEGMRESYREGKIQQLDVLDARRTLFETRAAYVEALAAYHRARAEVEGLAGRSLVPSGRTARGGELQGDEENRGDDR